MVWSKVFPGNSVLSIQELSRGNTTRYRGISQKFRFPVKYFLAAKAQRSLAKSERNQLQWEKWHLRKKLVTLYYAIYSVQKTLQLIKGNRDILREFSRVAEKKYAAGKASPSDSMKGHFALTQIELQLVQIEEEEHALQAQLRAVMDDLEFPLLRFPKKELSIPIFYEHKIQKPLKELTRLLHKNSPELKKQIHLLHREEWKSSLEKWEFAPDIELKYQERISGSPEDSKIQSIHFHFPLWFFSQKARASSQSSRRKVQEYLLESTQKHLITELIRLRKKVSSGAKILKIYKTSLIPQSLGAYNYSKASYQANKSSFLAFMDSERSLLNAKIGFYRAFRHYVESICHLELVLGFRISNIDSKGSIGSKGAKGSKDSIDAKESL